MVAEKLTQTELRKQIGRLKCLPRGEERPWGTDKEPGLRDELLKALWTQAVSDEHAIRIIDSVIATAQFCPVPSELIAAAQEIPERIGILREPEPNCGACGGSGWKRTQVGEYSGVERCKCTVPVGAKAQ